MTAKANSDEVPEWVRFLRQAILESEKVKETPESRHEKTSRLSAVTAIGGDATSNG